jgi:STE24 endopeptidase
MTKSIDTERQRKAKEYAGIKRRLYVVSLALGLVVLLFLLFSGTSTGLANWLESLLQWRWAVIALYFIIVGAGYSLLTSPLDYYSGFVLPHRYGLSVQSLGSWLSDQFKGTAIGGVLGLLAVEVVYWLLDTVPNWWWLIAATLMLLFTVILANLAPVLIMPLFNKFTPLADDELRDRLLALAQRAGTKVRGVFVMDMSRRSTAANAALMGWGNTRRIVLGDTLFGKYNPDEIEAILAHELGHHVHRDIWKGIAVQTVLTLGGLFLVDQGLRLGVSLFGFSSIADVAAFPVVGLVFLVFGLVIMPLGNAATRLQEGAADDYALEMTKKPRSFATMMAKLADQNLSDLSPERWVVIMFYSHPPAAERIAKAERFEQAHGSA